MFRSLSAAPARVSLFVLMLLATLFAGCGDSGGVDTAGAGGSPTTPKGAPRHVFILVLENKSYADTFGAGATSGAPYLSSELPKLGVLLTQYHGTGHVSLDNYITMVGGQSPNFMTSSDCMIYQDWQGTTTPDAIGQVTGFGCVYPAAIKTVANQLQDAGFSWKGYMQDMGNDASRDGRKACSHPAINSQDGTQTASATDQYATRHNPFMYYHAIIDDDANCQAHVVELAQLETDLKSAATTPNYSFITPDLCADGHDATCADTSVNGGLKGIDDFLKKWVPLITSSDAFKQDGLLLITFDEANVSQNAVDAEACCAEPTGPNTVMPGITGGGGGRIGGVVISPFTTPGTVSTVPYNHYSMLRSVEDMFGLKHLGYAGQSGLVPFGKDVYAQ